MVPIFFQNLSGEAFCHLYLEFSNYILSKVINKLVISESIKLNSIDLNDCNLTDRQTKSQFDSYQKEKVDIEEATNHWINEMHYFIDTNHKLMESIKIFDQNKTKVLKETELKLLPDINLNEETLIYYMNELRNDVQKLTNILNSLNNNANKNWKIYLKSFESQINPSLYSSISLNDLSQNSTENKNLFDCMVRNLEFRIKIYDTTIERNGNFKKIFNIYTISTIKVILDFIELIN